MQCVTLNTFMRKYNYIKLMGGGKKAQGQSEGALQTGDLFALISAEAKKLLYQNTLNSLNDTQ